MPDWFKEFSSSYGAPALIFYCFYLVQKANTGHLTKVIGEVFGILKSLIEQQALQISYLQQIDTKVSNNLWCPIARDKVNGGKDE